MTTDTTHITKEGLLPCPFCGAKAEYTSNEFHKDNSMAMCVSCGASLYWRKWNTRAAELSAQESKPVDDPAYVHAVEKNALLLEHTRRAVALGMAAIAIYGKRDENGLTGLSKKHWQELSDLTLDNLAAPSVSAQESKPVAWMMELAEEIKANALDHPKDYISKFALIWADQLACRAIGAPSVSAQDASPKVENPPEKLCPHGYPQTVRCSRCGE